MSDLVLVDGKPISQSYPVASEEMSLKGGEKLYLPLLWIQVVFHQFRLIPIQYFMQNPMDFMTLGINM